MVLNVKSAAVQAAFATIICLPLFGLIPTAPAKAGEIGETNGDLTFRSSERVNDSRGGTNIVTRTVSGLTHAKDKGGPLDEATVRCHMTFVRYVAKERRTQGSGYCAGIVGNGDTWEMLLSGDDTGGTWKFVDGTGRYEGIKGSGRWLHKGTPRERNERYEWTARWELKD